MIPLRAVIPRAGARGMRLEQGPSHQLSSQTMTQCHLCKSKSVGELLDYGNQPISNRLLKSSDEQERSFPLGLSQCRKCGLLQLTVETPAAEHVPPFDWLLYFEPEEHLDQMTQEIIETINLQKDAVILGLTYKDSSTLDRFGKAGYERLITLDPATDLGIDSPNAGIETIQDRLTPDRTAAIADKYGKADLIIVRHVLEHAHDPHRFMAALEAMLKPDGRLVMEIPDFSAALENLDYSYIWEEHIVYFTPSVFTNCFYHFGFEVMRSMTYHSPVESCLAVILRRAEGAVPQKLHADVLSKELARGARYASSFPEVHQKLNDYLAQFRRDKGSIAIFGSGHLACKFINLLGLKNLLEFTVDDHPKKQGLYMPGSRLPILGSETLIERNIQLCLMSLKPESEEKVLKKNEKYVKQGGIFASIFPASPRSLEF